MYQTPGKSEHLQRYPARHSKLLKDDRLLLQALQYKMTSPERRLLKHICHQAQLKPVWNIHSVRTQIGQLLQPSRRVQPSYAAIALQRECKAHRRVKTYQCDPCFQSTTRLYLCRNRPTSRHKHHQRKFLGNRSVARLTPLDLTSLTAMSPQPEHRLYLRPRRFSRPRTCLTISG